MPTSLSVFLDFLRILAASVITLGHLSTTGFTYGYLPDAAWSHFALIMFFVISGFCVAYTRSEKHPTLAHYAVARFSRVYSILIPALALTAILYFIGSFINPAHYAKFSSSSEPWAMVLTAFNLQEMWFTAAAPLSNSAVWTLSYLFWFYVLYGVMTYLKGAVKFAWMGLIIFWMGPKVLLLLPCWLVGMMCYYVQPFIQWGRSNAAVVLMMSITLLIGFSHFIPPLPGAFGEGYLRYSNAFATDIIQSFLIGFIILSLKELFVTFPERTAGFIRKSAGFTFSLFLVSQPLFIFMGGLLPLSFRQSILGCVLTYVFVLLFAWLFGHFEKAKGPWAELFKRLFHPPEIKNEKAS